MILGEPPSMFIYQSGSEPRNHFGNTKVELVCVKSLVRVSNVANCAEVRHELVAFVLLVQIKGCVSKLQPRGSEMMV